MLIKESFTLSNQSALSGQLSFYAVYDGHGGRQAAIYTRDHLFQFLLAELEAGKGAKEALRSAFLQTDNTFIAACRGEEKDGESAADKEEHIESEKDSRPQPHAAAASASAASAAGLPPPINTSSSSSSSAGLDHDTSGTTAVAVLISHASHTLWVAHVGDSRAVLLSSSASASSPLVLPLTSDHKADRPDEVERIRAAGGFVVHKRVMGELAISRAIGDLDFKVAHSPPHCRRVYCASPPSSLPLSACAAVSGEGLSVRAG